MKKKFFGQIATHFAVSLFRAVKRSSAEKSFEQGGLECQCSVQILHSFGLVELQTAKPAVVIRFCILTVDLKVAMNFDEGGKSTRKHVKLSM